MMGIFKSEKGSSLELLVAHLVPVGIFTVAIFGSTFLVTACGSDRASILKNGGDDAAIAPTNLQGKTPVISAATLQNDLAGAWQCMPPRTGESCTNQILTFSAPLDQITLETLAPTGSDAGTDEAGSCHIIISFKSSAQPQSDGSVSLTLNQTSLGTLVADPSNSPDCQRAYTNQKSINLNVQESLTHNANWTQITFQGITYSKEAAGTQTAANASAAEAWIGL